MIEIRWLCRRSMSLRRADTDRLVVQSRTMLEAVGPGHRGRLGTLLTACGRDHCGRGIGGIETIGLQLCCVWSLVFSRRFICTSDHRYYTHIPNAVLRSNNNFALQHILVSRPHVIKQKRMKLQSPNLPQG